MKIKKVKISNFRAFKGEVTVDFSDLNVFVGKNDIGKSTVLEALDIFFNEKEAISKIEKNDINIVNAQNNKKEISISVVFENLPSEVTLDATNPTTLRDEYLLRRDGTLEIKKEYPDGGKEKVFITAEHPTNEKCQDLLIKKMQN